VNELDLASQQAAFGVDILGPDGHRQQRRFSGAGERAGFRHAEAYFQGLLGGGRQARGRHAERCERGQHGRAKASPAGKACSSLHHRKPPMVQLLVLFAA
jgi:hypothetical protein